MDDRITLAKLEPREQDVVDVVSILKAFDIEDFDRVDNEVIRSTILEIPGKQHIRPGRTACCSASNGMMPCG